RLGGAAWGRGPAADAVCRGAAAAKRRPAGPLADRLGYLRPVWIAVGRVAGAVPLTAASTRSSAASRNALPCVAATTFGSGASMASLKDRRGAVVATRSGAEPVRVFGWLALALAPAPSNVPGAVRT
ncbi:MAG: MFS transporter, partial [Burkholderiales bacterium]|nr:MFS transporter [Burkholderiales bacterium]